LSELYSSTEKGRVGHLHICISPCTCCASLTCTHVIISSAYPVGKFSCPFFSLYFIPSFSVYFSRALKLGSEPLLYLPADGGSPCPVSDFVPNFSPTCQFSYTCAIGWIDFDLFLILISNMRRQLCIGLKNLYPKGF